MSKPLTRGSESRVTWLLGFDYKVDRALKRKTEGFEEEEQQIQLQRFEQ